MVGIAEKIKQQENAVAESIKKIATMKEQEAKRILRLADKAGFFEVEIPDDKIQQAFADLVKSTKASA